MEMCETEKNYESMCMKKKSNEREGDARGDK